MFLSNQIEISTQIQLILHGIRAMIMASSTNLNTTNMNQSIETTFSFITPIKLDRSNYMLWRNQVLASIRGNMLEGYINGEKVAPTQFLTSGSYAEAMERVTQQVENPEYTIWRSQD